MTPEHEQLAPPGGWHEVTRRLAPLELARLSPPLRFFFKLAGRWGEQRTGTTIVPDVFLLLLRQPRLFWAWLRFASRLMPFGTLDRRDAELVILRVGWNCRCRYEWGQHVTIGLRAGLRPEDIRRVAEGPQAPGWQERQVLLLQAADELHRERIIAPATWQRLAGHYKPAQLIEIGMLVGHYEMLAGLLNSAGLGLEPQAEAQLAQSPIHPGQQ